MTGKHGEPGMKRITFWGYAENCNCTYCKSLREIMEHEEKLHVNSFKLEEDSHMSNPIQSKCENPIKEGKQP